MVGISQVAFANAIRAGPAVLAGAGGIACCSTAGRPFCTARFVTLRSPAGQAAENSALAKGYPERSHGVVRRSVTLTLADPQIWLWLNGGIIGGAPPGGASPGALLRMMTGAVPPSSLKRRLRLQASRPSPSGCLYHFSPVGTFRAEAEPVSLAADPLGAPGVSSRGVATDYHPGLQLNLSSTASLPPSVPSKTHWEEVLTSA